MSNRPSLSPTSFVPTTQKATRDTAKLRRVKKLYMSTVGSGNKQMNTNKKPNKEDGFSLIEVIVYFAIFGIITGLIATVFNFALQGKIVVTQLTEVQLNTQRVMEQMIDRVRFSATINDASTSLNLKMSSSTLDPTIFGLSSGAVTIKEGSGPVVEITPSTIYVTSLLFTKITNPDPSTSTVKIEMTVGYNEDGTAKTGTLYSLQTVAMPLR